MALANFSHPFGALTRPIHQWGATISPVPIVHQLPSNANNLLYAQADHQQQGEAAPPAGSDYYKNNPYAPPQLHQQRSQQQSYQYSSNTNNNNNNNNNRRKSGSTYLPPIPPPGARNTQYYHQQQQQQQQQQFSHTSAERQQQQINGNNVAFKSDTSAATASASATRTYGEGSYSHFPAASGIATTPTSTQPPQERESQYYNAYGATQQTRTSATSSSSSFSSQIKSQLQTPNQNFGAAREEVTEVESGNDVSANAPYPQRPPGFTRVQAGQGSRTQVHAVLDYDLEEGDEEQDYYDAEDQGEHVHKDAGSKKSPMPTVTPIQGPIFLKNGTVPVVPLFSYPTINNGTFVQIPIWWTALSVALGLDVRGDIIKGVPCIKRYHQLFCPTAGNSYPIDKIERFIDDNKALMRRMYGDFEMSMDGGGPLQQTKKRKRRFIDEPDIFIPPGAFPASMPDDEGKPHTAEAGESYFGQLRNRRQASDQQNRNRNKSGQGQPGNPGSTTQSSTGRLDACESKIEIVTPYWASNSAGKIRAIVNTQHFEQAIHQEICSKTQTPRCTNDCGCEQKYKWHRLLAYDPDNDCKGIFMDWFLFPSCCVCRCTP